ncbi:MAG: hypothetical protein K0S04_350, partial [Herbinix sp.]|nr:hypothetical protein [Herbinix sp.]
MSDVKIVLYFHTNCHSAVRP